MSTTDRYEVTIVGCDGALRCRSFEHAEDLARTLLLDGYDVQIDDTTFEVVNWDTSEIGPRS